MRPIHPDLIARLRRPDSTAQVMVEARVEGANDTRQRYDQWQTLDPLPVDPTTHIVLVELLDDGGVRLKAGR